MLEVAAICALQGLLLSRFFRVLILVPTNLINWVSVAFIAHWQGYTNRTMIAAIIVSSFALQIGFLAGLVLKSPGGTIYERLGDVWVDILKWFASNKPSR